MKKWMNAEITEMNINETANGGMPSKDFDQLWYDENGALHANFTDTNAPAPVKPEAQNS